MAEARKESGVRSQSGARIKVLVVDDEAIIRMYIKRVLERSGCGVDDARSVREAYDYLARTAYDLVLLDGHLLDGHGSEIARYIRQELRWPSVPIVAISSDRSADHIHLLRDSGVNHFLEKPFALDKVMQLVDDLAHDGDSTTAFE